MTETIYVVHWSGPYKWSLKKLDKVRKFIKPYHVLYQVYGPHPLYGREVLLYLGMSDAKILDRLQSVAQRGF